MRRSPLLLAVLLLPAVASAKDIDAASSISAVTVYLQRAQVTRQFSVDLPAGSHTILINGLPAGVLEQSLRARGQASGKLSIGSVETRRVYDTVPTAEREKKLTAELQRLQDEKDQLDGRQQALDTQASFIEKLAALPSEKDKNGNRIIVPEKWPAAWQAIGNGMTEVNKARGELKIKQRGVADQIKKVEQELNQLHSSRRDSITAAINVEAAQPTHASFELTYQVPGASWAPVYDAQLQTEQQHVQLTQAALVRQVSGEDWDNVALTVSTARPSAAAAMPQLQPWWIDFYRPMPRATLMREMKAKASDELMASGPAAAVPMEAEEEEATTDASEFALSYRVPGKVSVSADNSRQRFVLARQQLKVQLAARTTPRLDDHAYLYAELDYAGDTPLLAGSWRLSRDDTYVGETQQPTLRPGAQLALAFGADDGIEVAYHVLKNEQGEKGIFSKETRIERRYRMTINNRHRTGIPVSVYDQIPVARNEQIKVVLSDDTTPPTERDPDGKVGLLVWKQELKPQAKQEIKFGYSVSYPQDKEVPGF